jgi:hypothetical protein
MIPKREIRSRSLNDTQNMAKRKMTKRQPMADETPHRQRNMEGHKPSESELIVSGMVGCSLSTSDTCRVPDR